MNYSDQITRAFFGLSARDRHNSYLRFIAVDDDGTDDLGFSGDELAQLRAADRPSPAMITLRSGAR